MSSRLFDADMARIALEDLGVPFTSEQDKQISENEDLRDYLSTLNPWCEDDQAEWDRVADELEYQANRSEWESYLEE